MACNPTRIELSNSAATTVQITLATNPGDGTAVTFQVDGLGVSESGFTTGAVVSFVIAAVSASENSLWDVTIQVGANSPVQASAVVTESNDAQAIGVTLSDSGVTYCSPIGAAATDPVAITISDQTPPYLWADWSGIDTDTIQLVIPTVGQTAGQVPFFGYGYEATWSETNQVFTTGPKYMKALGRSYTELYPGGPIQETLATYHISAMRDHSYGSCEPVPVTVISGKYGSLIHNVSRRWNDADSTNGENMPSACVIGTVEQPSVSASFAACNTAFSNGINGGTF